MKELGSFVLGIGLLAMGLGLLWPWVERLGLDRLGFGHVPGDILIDQGDLQLRLPLGTATVIGLLVAAPLLLWRQGLG
jgi:hypothetical protein